MENNTPRTFNEPFKAKAYDVTVKATELFQQAYLHGYLLEYGAAFLSGNYLRADVLYPLIEKALTRETNGSSASVAWNHFLSRLEQYPNAADDEKIRWLDSAATLLT